MYSGAPFFITYTIPSFFDYTSIMKLELKYEFIIGIASIVICLVLVVYHFFAYEKLTSQLSASPATETISQETKLDSQQIALHKTPQDCWIIVENKVYDVTDFLSRHPGGGQLISPYCGMDATQPFLTQGGRGSHSSQAEQLLQLIYIGEVNGTILHNKNADTIKNIPINSDDD